MLNMCSDALRFCVCSDPVVVPVESEEEKAEHSDPEKEEDVGITFVARKVETPKQRPKSGTHTLVNVVQPQHCVSAGCCRSHASAE